MGVAFHLVVAALFGVIGVYFTKTFKQWKHSLPLPPGPKGHFLFGNITDMPKTGELEAFHWLKHKDLYGA